MNPRTATVPALVCAMLIAATVTAAELPFGARITLDDAYSGPVSVTTGDFDGDGVDDIVASGYLETSLAWWRSEGDGTFTRYQVVASATDISDVETGDVNGDGRLDIVVTAAGDTDAVGWYENNGTPSSGGWPLRLITWLFDDAIGAAVGDVDGNGTLDVVGVAASADQVAVAFNNNGTGIGWSYETLDAAFDGAIWTAAGDIDHDGDLDVVAAALYSGEISWWSRDGGGGTWTEHPIVVVADACVSELEDMDRDGDLDVLGAPQNGALTWWENDSAGGTWAAHTVGDPAGAVTAAYVVDLDRDGDPDVIYASYGAGGVGWFENTSGDATSWTEHVVDHALTGAWDVAAADLDADGDLDLVAVDYLLDTVAVWLNLSIHRSATLPAASSIAGAMNHVKAVRPADVDRDGDLDLLVADVIDQIVGWLENLDGTGTSWSLTTVGTSFPAEAVAAGDLDDDGDLDLVATSTGAVHHWRSDGPGVWTELDIPTSHSSDDAVALADLDGDGDLDIMLGSSSDGLDWQENLGSGGSWAEHSAGGGYIWDADSMALVDLDRDGDDDVVIANFDRVQWTPNDLEGSGSFGAEVVIATGLTNPRSVAVGDIDGDGDVDVASVDQATGEVLWWADTAGNGSSWGAATVVASGLPKPQEVALADLDTDGDLDLVVAAEDQSLNVNWLGWFENTSGDGSGWATHVMAVDAYRVLSLAVADLDGDGDPDLAQSDLGAQEVQLWLNLGGQAALITTALAPLTLDPLTLEAMLGITAVHRGRAGDGDAEVASLELLLTDGVGTPLVDSTTNALLVGLYVFEDDDDSGTFDPVLDTEIASVDTFSLTDGVLTVDLPDGMDNVWIAPGLQRTLFVALAFENDVAYLAPTGLEITHLATDGIVEDRDHDLPLNLEWRPDLASGVVVPTDPDILFADGFESGTTGAWADVVP